MAFRAQEAAEENFERARRLMVPRELIGDTRRELTEHLLSLTERLGPVVDSYPSWHPLVPQPDQGLPFTDPCDRNGWDGLDHTVYFVNGFLTCPYDGADGARRVEASARGIEVPECVTLNVEILDRPYYGEGTTPILVSCEWDVSLEEGRMIPKSRAVPLMLETEVPSWRYAQFAEGWETMRPYLLGCPHGARSSLFVSQDTALAMKKIYEMLVDSGMYGAEVV
jgi:hypothetical protein